MLKVILIFYIKYVNWWFKICTFVDTVYITGATLVAFLIAIIIMCTDLLESKPLLFSSWSLALLGH